VPGLSAWFARRRGFGYLRTLWDRWAAPGWRVPEAHWTQVRQTMERSWPAPLEHYRRMAFGGPEAPIATPLLYLLGDRDGCVEATSARGQERHFSGALEQRTVAEAGHSPHLEKPETVEPAVVDWLRRAA
jgi:pimeloyl-ACP methyl ester carboxylesterase